MIASPVQATDRGSGRSLQLVLPPPSPGLPPDVTPPRREYPPRWPAVVITAAGALSLALGVLVIVGWHTGHVLSPTALWFESVPVRYNAGVCFVCGGLALLLLSRGKIALARFAAAPLAIIGLLTGCEYLLNVSLGIDELLFLNTRLAPSLSPRMAPNTAVCFSILGGILLLARGKPSALHNTLQAFAAGVVATMGLVGFIGYVAHIPTAYGWGSFTAMAAATAAMMVALGAGAIAFAWRQHAATSPSLPSWSPLLAGATLGVGSVALWQALHVLHPRSSLDILALTVGLFQAALLYLVLHLLRGARERARELRQLNSVLQLQVHSRERAERELQDKQAYTRSLIEASVDPLVTIAPDGKITDVNAATEAVTGCTRQELIGTDFSDYFTQPDKARSGYQQVFREGGVHDYELEIRHRDGRVTPVLYNASIYHDEAGKVIGVFASARDVTERKRLEEELRARQAYTRSLIEASVDPLVTIAPDGKITDVNAATEAVTGCSRQELIGTDFSDYFTQPEKARSGYQQVFREGGVHDYELEIRHRDGRLTPVLYNASVYHDQAGKVIGVFAAARDISERKRSEQALRQSEERYRALVLASAQIVWGTPPEGLVEDMPMWREYTGQSLAEVRGWGWLDAIHPEDRQTTEAAWTKALAERGIYETEYRIRRRDGCYRHFAIRGVPVLNEDGSIREWVGICTDIHERKQIEDEMRRQAALLNLAHDAILVCDMEQRIVFWNRGAEETYGWETKAAIGHVSPQFLHTEYPVPLPELLARVRQRGEWEGELKHRTRDGTSIVVASRWSLQRDHHGAPSNILEINRDITERKRLEDSLRQRTLELENSVGELEAFSYSVSHDLRAPLRSIDGFSQILLEDYHDQVDKEGQDCLRRIRVASQNMGQLIDALLQLSRVMRSELLREPVDLSLLALSTAALIQKAEPSRHVRFRVASGLQGRGDRRLLAVALQNLLQNAWKFTARNSESVVEFGSTQKDGKTAYFVRDNGVGFDMAYVNKLFTPFQRLHAKEQFEGTGIGLATVQRVIKRHGGKVWAEGAVGKGATFNFSLE